MVSYVDQLVSYGQPPAVGAERHFGNGKRSYGLATEDPLIVNARSPLGSNPTLSIPVCRCRILCEVLMMAAGVYLFLP
jgi:hypothetical protein